MKLETNPQTNQTIDSFIEEYGRSPWVETWIRFFKHRFVITGGLIILAFLLAAIFAPYIASQHPEDYSTMNLAERLKPPSAEYWFGTDDFGRDILSRIIYGGRITLWIGFASVIGSVVVGSVLGILAGYYGRWIDMLISRLFDIMLAFPAILLAIAIVAILGPSLINALIAISIVNIPTYGRLIRSKVLSLKEEEYITAARAIGMKHGRIIWKHILPNSLAPVIVQATMGIGTAVLDAAALGFLGLGAQPPDPEWGRMLSDARNYIQHAPWIMIFPGLAIMLTVLGFNLLGDGLRDVLDPKMRD